MMYKTRPVFVDAMRFSEDFRREKGVFAMPGWCMDAIAKGKLAFGPVVEGGPATELYVVYENGMLHVPVGYYIIREESGEIFALSPDDFNARYEEVEER